MHETPSSYSQLESPAPGTLLPQGRHRLRGWVWPKAGGHFTDVRACVGGKIFAGVHGMPRADLAAHFKTGRAVALAEFSIAVDLPPGPARIALEVLAIEGRWSVFQVAVFDVVPSATPVHFAVPGGALRWIDHGHAFQQLLREAARRPEQPLATLAAQLAAELPYPRVLRDAPAPLLGYMDEPATVCCSRYGRIPAFGHLFHPELRTRRILGTVDLQSWQPLAHHQPSPGPAAHYPQHHQAQACGFAGLVDVPAQLPNPVSLRIYAELEDGSLHLGPVVRTRLHSAEEEKTSLAVPSRDFFQTALTTWEQALAERNLAVAREPELERFLADLRATQATPVRRRPAMTNSPLLETVAASSVPLPRRVLLATHGLSLQGAPRFLLDLGRAFAAAGVTIRVVSAEDGPLRGEFEKLGAVVAIADATEILQAGTPADATAALDRQAPAADWAATDLVVANSFTTFWAVHAAKRAGRPVLLYVHESTTPAVFYQQRVSPAVIALAEEAFALADLVSFTTSATRQYHLDYGRPERHRLTPGWVDVAAVDRGIAGLDRTALRREFGLPPGGQLVCNIGTVSDRKGQHTFIRAVDLLWRRYPDLAARTKFILLGGRDTPFDTMLAESLAELGRPNLVVHPETPDYLRYYVAADLFACSSYEESSPRVVLEAMACRAPILASAVHGIPELVRPDLEAGLLPPGDTAAWAEGLARMLAAPAIGRELADRARARVVARFDLPAVMPRHLSLAGSAATGRF